MKIILTEDIPKLGSVGDIVVVKPGYGRNYLLPSGKAMLATQANLARLDSKHRLEERRVRQSKREAEHMAERLANVSCTVRVQADDSDKLYGSVGPREIAGALEDQGVELDVNSILLPDPIKMLGVYSVGVELFEDVKTEIKVWVIRE